MTLPRLEITKLLQGEDAQTIVLEMTGSMSQIRAAANQLKRTVGSNVTVTIKWEEEADGEVLDTLR